MAEGTDMVKCPVCGTEIEVGSQVAKLYGAVRAAPRANCTYEGKEYHFCCKACKKKFEENPTTFVK
jgi:YHS domain-containing protein